MYFSLGPCPIYGSFQGLRELFSIPFPKDRTINRKTFDLLRLAWSNCSSDFTPLQATLNTTTAASPLLAQQPCHPIKRLFTSTILGRTDDLELARGAFGPIAAKPRT